MDEKDVTFFSLDIYPGNGYIENFLHSECLKRVKTLFPNSKVKVFTPDDDIVKECFEKHKDYIKKLEEQSSKSKRELRASAYIADIVRLYICSKLDNHLYFDLDVYFFDNCLIQDLDEKSKFIEKCFCLLWSGKDHEPFNKLLSCYNVSNEDLFEFCDTKIMQEAKEKHNIKFDYFTNCNFSHYSTVIIRPYLKSKFVPLVLYIDDEESKRKVKDSINQLSDNEFICNYPVRFIDDIKNREKIWKKSELITIYYNTNDLFKTKEQVIEYFRNKNPYTKLIIK